MNAMILDAAVLAEAVALAGIITLAIRMRLRLNRLDAPPDYRATVQQMAELVAEAQALSSDLAEQIAGQVQVAESLIMHTHSQQAAVPARKTTPKAAVTLAPKVAAAPQASVRARATRAAAEPPADEAANDMIEARQKGMDPLGVALQRALRRRAATA